MNKDKICILLIIIIFIFIGETILLSIQNKQLKSKISLYNKLSKNIINKDISEEKIFPNITLKKRNKEEIRLYDLTKNENINILFYQNNCSHCESLINKNLFLLRKLSDKIVIILLSSSEDNKSKISELEELPFFYIDQNDKRLINIISVPCLIKIKANGKILNQLVGNENISREINDMTRKEVKDK